MPPDLEKPREHPADPIFPTLPIISAEPPRRTERARYGGLFYLGVGGLAVLVLLIGWFAFGVWSMRDVWGRIYVLHDAGRSEAERVEAASALAGDPRVNQRQLWDMCLQRRLPDLARYRLAEGLTADAAVDDPRAYGLSVARSEGWPDWLRLLLARPIAYAAALGKPVAREPLLELTAKQDPALVLWARFALAASAQGDPESAKALEREAAGTGPDQELARILVEALRASGSARIKPLDRATAWLRTHHPGARTVWRGWEVRSGRIVPEAAATSP